MKKSRITNIILFSVLGVLLLVYFIFSNDSEKRYQWYESYRSDSDQPYGTLFIKKLLESYRPGGSFILNDRKPLSELLDSLREHNNTDYVFIGQSLHLTDADANALLNFIFSGNDAFIATHELPPTLITRVYTMECDSGIFIEGNEAESATINFYHDTLRTSSGYTYVYRFGSDDHPYYWGSLNKQVFCDSTKSLIPLGYQEPQNVNFFKMQYGLGNLYVHSSPLVFTNYFLTKPDKADYASGVFSHLKGENMIWDEYSKVAFSRNNNAYNSPLYYILQQPSLKYAWWMMLLCVVLYVLFAAKRRQRIIPVLEAKANTSLEFVNLISALHYQNSNHLDIARKKMRYFLYFIRAKYGIHAQVFKEEQVRRLSEKSKVSAGDIQVIFDQYNLIERQSHYNTAADRLVNLYYAIDNFYKHCK